MLIGTGNETRAERERAATVDEQLAAFTRLYEAKAFLVYNVALRITCECKSAVSAAESAFLRQAEPGATEASLLPAVVVAATGHAKRKPNPGGVGDTELQLLRNVATLPPPERAALALTVMADLPIDETGAMLQLARDPTVVLLERATAGFATAAGVEAGAVYDLYVEWGWAEPPQELWEKVYPAFRRALDRPAANEGDAPTQVLPAAAGAGRPGFLRRWRRRFVAVATVALAAVIVAGVLAATQGGSGSGDPESQALQPPVLDYPGQQSSIPDVEPPTLPEASGAGEVDPVAAMQAKKHEPLTPKELDQLRLKELAALRNYQKRQTDKRLTQAQREYASRKVNAIRQLAHERAQVRRDAKAVASRERALARAQQRLERQRQREAAKEAQQQRPTTPAQQEPTTKQPKPKPSGSSEDGGTNDNGPPTSEEAATECVQDTESGAYICPEG